MTTPPNWDRIGRYLAGESPPDEAAEVRQWLAEHSADARVIDALHAATSRLTSSEAVDIDAALRRVKARSTASGASTTPARFARFTGNVEMLGAAAAILLVAGVFLFRRADTVRQPAPEVSYQTGVGQRDSVVLEDGSTVLLGPASRLLVRGNEVELSGEAFFRVVHDEARPFTVHAGGAVIRDVGTEFSVHSDAAAPVRVVVREGAVAFLHQSDSVMLRPGDVGVAANGRVEARRGAATEDDLAWTRGELVFRDATVGQLAADLRRWYGVELRVTDSALLRRHFTGSFETEPVHRVLDVIALAFGARVERRGDTAYIRPTTPAK